MTTEEIAVQVSRASILAYRYTTKEIATKWFNEGQDMIIIKSLNEKQLNQMGKIAFKNDLNVWNHIDYSIPEKCPGTLTCMAIGPDENSIIDKAIIEMRLKKIE